MNDSAQAGMAEATRLTRAGRLNEATALLQRLLHRGEPGPAPTPPDSPPQAPGLVHRLLDGLRGLGRAQPDRPPVAEPAAASGRFVASSYADAAGTRAYKLYVPSAAAGGQPLPLVVMLHGCTQSPDDFAAGTRMNKLAEERGCYVAYPEQDQRANAQRCWNWFQPADQARGRGEPSLVAGIARAVMAEHRVDPRRVYVAGLSAGGAAAAVVAQAYPDLFAAVGVHSGLACGAARDLPSALAAMRQGPNGMGGQVAAGPLVPTIVFHGDQDRTVNPANGDHVVTQALRASAGLRSEIEQGRAPGGLGYSRTVYTDGDGRAVLERWAVHGAGHAWSGGSPDCSYTEPRGPDASREMLRFFLAHHRSAAAS